MSSTRKTHKERSRELEHAKLNPRAAFASPSDVVEDSELSNEDKMSILDQWEVDAQALSRANDEGMTTGEPPRLSEVQRARRKLAGGARTTKDRRTTGKPVG